MTAPEKIFVTVEYIGKTDTVVCGAFGTYPMDESVEFTRTDLSQAAVAAALESAAVIAETHQVYQAHVCAARIRALTIHPADPLSDPAQIRADAIREAASIARDHTPEKHSGMTLASHVTGRAIETAILAILATPLSPTAIDGSPAPDAGSKEGK